MDSSLSVVESDSDIADNQVNGITNAFISERKFLSFFYNFDVGIFYIFLFVQKTKKYWENVFVSLYYFKRNLFM